MHSFLQQHLWYLGGEIKQEPGVLMKHVLFLWEGASLYTFSQAVFCAQLAYISSSAGAEEVLPLNMGFMLFSSGSDHQEYTDPCGWDH